MAGEGTKDRGRRKERRGAMVAGWYGRRTVTTVRAFYTVRMLSGAAAFNNT